MAIPQHGPIHPQSPLADLTPRRAWLILRAVVVLGFLAYGLFKGYQLAVLLAVFIVGPWALLHWLRGGELEPVRTAAVEDDDIPPGCWDLSESTRRDLDSANRLERTNLFHKRD